MQLLHIISSLQRGGAEMALANLLSHTQEHAQHKVIFFHDGPVRKTIEDIGIPCLQIHATGSYVNPLFVWRLLRAIKQFAPDCIHTDLWAANLLGRICAWWLKIPCVSVVHAMSEHEGKIRAYIDRFIPCTPTTYVAVSDAVRGSLATHKRLHVAPCLVIKNGIDAQAVRSCPATTAVARPQNSFIIGAVGRLITEKNYDLLLHSFAELHARYPHVHLMIVGSGPEEQKLHQLAADLQITESISWIGNRLAHPYYQFFDCYVQPSRSEGLSIALLEALSCSLPVIVTGKNKSHEVIQNTFNGLVIEPQDTSALFSALEMYLTDVEIRATCGNNGYATVTEKFSLDATAMAYMKLFQEVTARRS